MMMQRVIVSKHQKTSMYLGQWNRNNVPVGNYFGLDCMYHTSLSPSQGRENEEKRILLHQRSCLNLDSSLLVSVL